VLAAIIANASALAILLHYMLLYSPKALLAFATAVTASFTVERIYRSITKRKLKVREVLHEIKSFEEEMEKHI
jgi:hypothetical protein